MKHELLLVGLMALFAATSSAASAQCQFTYVKSPMISSFDGEISLMPLRVVVDASEMKLVADDVSRNLVRCESDGGVCIELGDGPLFVPKDWAPRRAVWIHGNYTYDQAPPIDDPRANGQYVLPVTVLFKNSAGRMEPLSIYLLDEYGNLVGFDPKIGAGKPLTTLTTIWGTSPYLLMDEKAPIECFKVAGQ